MIRPRRRSGGCAGCWPRWWRSSSRCSARCCAGRSATAPTSGVFQRGDQVAMVVLGLLPPGRSCCSPGPGWSPTREHIEVRTSSAGTTCRGRWCGRSSSSRGNPWVSLELEDDDLLAVMAVQATDKEHAVAPSGPCAPCTPPTVRHAPSGDRPSARRPPATSGLTTRRTVRTLGGVQESHLRCASGARRRRRSGRHLSGSSCGSTASRCVAWCPEAEHPLPPVPRGSRVRSAAGPAAGRRYGGARPVERALACAGAFCLGGADDADRPPQGRDR